MKIKFILLFVLLLTLSSCTSNKVVLRDETNSEMRIKETFYIDDCKLITEVYMNNEIYAIHTKYCTHSTEQSNKITYYVDNEKIVYDKEKEEWEIIQ